MSTAGSESAAVGRRPESVLVIIHTPDLDCLLLERVAPSGFWQSVTGSLRWHEAAADAARREVIEETGIQTGSLSDTGTVRRFPILPAWRDRYAPGVVENTEYAWQLCVPQRLPVVLNALEHRQYEWLPAAEAVAKVASWTNREALEALAMSGPKP